MLWLCRVGVDGRPGRYCVPLTCSWTQTGLITSNTVAAVWPFVPPPRLTGVGVVRDTVNGSGADVDLVFALPIEATWVALCDEAAVTVGKLTYEFAVVLQSRWVGESRRRTHCTTFSHYRYMHNGDGISPAACAPLLSTPLLSSL